MKPQAIRNITDLNALTRLDFEVMAQRCFAELNGGEAFDTNWHISLMAAKLQQVVSGKIKRLIINIPPRHLKSHLASVTLPAYVLGLNPTANIVCATYAQDLSDKFARDCRAVMQSDWYKACFGTKLTQTRAALQELITTKGGSRYATSVGGTLTGRGGDLIIIDDPIKPSDAQSEARRNSANEWFGGTLYPRLDSKATGSIIVIMQRLHEDDPTGHLLQQRGWELLSFPAIAEANETHVVETLFGRRTYTRKIGEALHPARENLETLDQIKLALGTYNFAAQYQQSPAPAGGGMVKEAWFRNCGPNELPTPFSQIIQSWDTANKPSELADYSVCTTWGIKDSRFYLLNVFRKKLAFPELKRAVVEQDALFKPTVILIEDRASGTQLIQELIAAGLSKVTRINPEGDKIMRLNAQTATIENGFVYIPNEALWRADYLHELAVFPNGRYDDQVDSTAQALAWMKQSSNVPGMLEFYRREAENNGSKSGIISRP